MRINRLVLENYGLFAGRNELELAPRVSADRKRPIVLVGGMNGAGKTTILDAIRLALYGRAAIGDRVSQKEYNEHLRGLVHRSRALLVAAPYSRVGLEFDFVARGRQETYYIERFWQLNNGTGITEDFEVRVKPSSSPASCACHDWPSLETTEPEYWQAFVSDIVPSRLSQLFFFDGEKIRNIASDISGNAAIGESIGALLGLDIVERLRADLSIYASREARSFGTAAEAERIEQLTDELAELLNKSSHFLSETLPELETQILVVQGEVGRLETRLQEEGSSFTGRRQSYEQTQKVLQDQIKSLLKDIAATCEGLFPLALCPNISRSLQRMIKASADERGQSLVATRLSGVRDDLIRRLDSLGLPSDLTERNQVIRLVNDVIDLNISQGKGATKNDLHFDLSDIEADRMREHLEAASGSVSRRMRQLCNELEAAERELQAVKKHLSRVPEQESLQPLFSDLSKKSQELGSMISRRASLQEEERQIQAAIAVKERERDRLVASIQKRDDASRRLSLVSTIQSTLDGYLARLTKFKVDTLSHAVARCFNQISRKEDLVKEIIVDPQTFAVTLRDSRGLPIPREELSSGEKQILAIALLWGLAQTSGRPLPVIIDTPLGRLDSAHRSNLVRHYFPHAAHQVILLSTDTEVDKVLFQELRHGVSHCYHLVYDQREARTYAKKEYFWEEAVNA